MVSNGRRPHEVTYDRLGRRRVPVVRDDYGPRPLPPWPTKHKPGTAGKLRVMAWRYRHEYQLFHPLDARGP